MDSTIRLRNELDKQSDYWGKFFTRFDSRREMKRLSDYALGTDQSGMER